MTGPVAPGGPLAGIEALRRDILRLRAEDAAARAALEAELDRLEADLDGGAGPPPATGPTD